MAAVGEVGGEAEGAVLALVAQAAVDGDVAGGPRVAGVAHTLVGVGLEGARAIAVRAGVGDARVQAVLAAAALVAGRALALEAALATQRLACACRKFSTFI